VPLRPHGSTPFVLGTVFGQLVIGLLLLQIDDDMFPVARFVLGSVAIFAMMTIF
jgi:hypothetical protein